MLAGCPWATMNAALARVVVKHRKRNSVTTASEESWDGPCADTKKDFLCGRRSHGLEGRQSIERYRTVPAHIKGDDRECGVLLPLAPPPAPVIFPLEMMMPKALGSHVPTVSRCLQAAENQSHSLRQSHHIAITLSTSSGLRGRRWTLTREVGWEKNVADRGKA